MELYQLQSFVTVARESHLTRAAAILHTSQPAVSAHIKALEEEFEQQLFTRTPRGMRLTSSGELLCEKAKDILSGVDSLTQLSQHLRQQPVGTVRIGLNRYSEFLRSTLLYQRLQNDYPGIELRFHQAVSGSILKMIRKNELDCGFVLGNYGEEDLQRIALAQLEIRVVGPVKMKAELAVASKTDLADLPWIGTSDDCPYSKIMDVFFHRQGLVPKIEVFADQQSAITSMVAAGVGLNFMLEEEAIEAEKKGQVVIWRGGSFPIELSFMYRVQDIHSSQIQAVVEVIHAIWNEDSSN